MKTIRCFCGKDILLDDEVYEELKDGSWSCVGLGVVRCTNSHTAIAHFVVAVYPKQVADHRDHNIHNNLRENLRVATYSQNGANRKIGKNNTSGCKGVSWQIKSRKWQVAIKKDGVTYYLGLFDSIRDAALAYNKKAIELHGEFAKLNSEEMIQQAESMLCKAH